jgi:hypothetical protein
MKCRYKYCKNDGNVSKEDAIKENGAYYCKDCYKEKSLKQQIEEYYIDNMPTTAIQLLRKVINQLLYTNNYEAEYVLFILKKIHISKSKINNPFGLGSYCNEGRNITEWKAKKVNEEYKAIKDNIISDNKEEGVKFNYKPNNKKQTDLI